MRPKARKKTQTETHGGDGHLSNNDVAHDAEGPADEDPSSEDESDNVRAQSTCKLLRCRSNEEHSLLS